MKKSITIVFAALVLAACTDNSPAPAANVAGVYQSADGKVSFTLTNESKVQYAKFGQTSEAPYSVADGIVKFKFSDGIEMKFKINQDGTLTSLTGTKYIKN